MTSANTTILFLIFIGFFLQFIDPDGNKASDILKGDSYPKYKIGNNSNVVRLKTSRETNYGSILGEWHTIMGTGVENKVEFNGHYEVSKNETSIKATTDIKDQRNDAFIDSDINGSMEFKIQWSYKPDKKAGEKLEDLSIKYEGKEGLSDVNIRVTVASNVVKVVDSKGEKITHHSVIVTYEYTPTTSGTSSKNLKIVTMSHNFILQEIFPKTNKESKK